MNMSSVIPEEKWRKGSQVASLTCFSNKHYIIDLLLRLLKPSFFLKIKLDGESGTRVPLQFI